jgi:hypothetical protein
MASGADHAARWLRGEPSGQETPEPDGHAQALVQAAKATAQAQALQAKVELLTELLTQLGVDVDDHALEVARRRLEQDQKEDRGRG